MADTGTGLGWAGANDAIQKNDVIPAQPNPVPVSANCVIPGDALGNLKVIHNTR